MTQQLTATLDDIIAHGNRGANLRDNNRITCADGFSVSVIAGGGAYCRPRPDLLTAEQHQKYGAVPTYPDRYGMADVASDYPGPYNAVEVGFPSARPEPWEPVDGSMFWSQYEDGSDGDPTESVYGYVPVELVRALIRLHGGEVES